MLKRVMPEHVVSAMMRGEKVIQPHVLHLVMRFADLRKIVITARATLASEYYTSFSHPS
jgi:hypothetical protein